MMGIVDQIIGGLGIDNKEQEHDIGDILEDMHQEVHLPPADFYIKPITLSGQEDMTLIKDELDNKNIILVAIDGKPSNNAKNKMYLDNLRDYVQKIGGDIAVVGERKILVTPKKVKIVKRKAGI